MKKILIGAVLTTVFTFVLVAIAVPKTSYANGTTCTTNNVYVKTCCVTTGSSKSNPGTTKCTDSPIDISTTAPSTLKDTSTLGSQFALTAVTSPVCGGNVNLSWKPVKGATWYAIRAYTGINPQVATLTSSPFIYGNSVNGGNNTFTDSTYKQGTYYYYIQAQGPNAPYGMTWNPIAAFSSAPCSTSITNSIPSAPTITSAITADDWSAGREQIEWNPVAGATGYNIYRSASSNGTYTKIFNIAGTYYYETPGQGTFYYKVTAVNAKGESAKSSAVSITTIAGPGGTTATSTSSTSTTPVLTVPTAPSTPTAVTAISNSLTWTPVTGVNGYIVYRSVANGAYTAIASTTVASYVDNQPGQGNYSYEVTALNSVGESAKSLPLGVNTSVSYTRPIALKGSFVGSLLASVWSAFSSLFK